MSDDRYDAVVLGGGHHATIIAPYLARAGMSVLVLERTAHLGGGACAQRRPGAGFVMNHCSHWTRFYGHPAYRDFALTTRGCGTCSRSENEGMIFDDGSSFIGFSASRVVDAAHRPPGALGGEHRAGRTTRSRGSRSATPTPTCGCSTPTSTLARRVPPPSLRDAAALGDARSARGAARDPRTA